MQSARQVTVIESLRAYLALWVAAAHVLELAGYWRHNTTGLLQLFAMPEVAVKVFVIVSGFVIFALLRSERETYAGFIVRRFLRLFPLLVVTFLVAIPISLLRLKVLDSAPSYLDPAWVSAMLAEIRSWWESSNTHLFLHLTLLHGLVPQSVVPYAPGAFLEPAWSVGLEWQFYVVAPLLYMATVSRNRFALPGVFLATLACVALRGRLPAVQYGAALPFHAEYFFVGALSYFVYERNQKNLGSPTAVACVLSLLVFHAGWRSDRLLPFCIWAVVLAVICERPDSLVATKLVPIFDNRISRFGGKISYSFYLSHMPVMFVSQFVILRAWPSLGRTQHLLLLFAATVAFSVVASVLLYRYVESPGIRLGRLVARGGLPARSPG